jgi:hypothetical protein
MIALIVLGFFWREAWLIFAAILLIDWGKERWKELLDAIRGKRRANSETISEPDTEIDEAQVERALAQSAYKHIPTLPWGDPSSYVKASTREELEQIATARQKEETDKRDFEAQEKERKKRDDERREQEARDFLNREAARVIKEREERDEQRKRNGREPALEPVISAPLIVLRPPSNEAEDEVCKCGYPGCLGHELIDNHAIFPGYTSEAAMSQSPHQIICFNVEVQGVAGNPSDGAVPESAIRVRQKS